MRLLGTQLGALNFEGIVPQGQALQHARQTDILMCRAVW